MRKLFFLGLCLAFNVLIGYAQPTNIDFSTGDLNGWQFEEAINLNSSLMTMGVPAASTQYSVMSAGATEINGIPIIMTSPLGGNFVRIGRTSIGNYAHKLHQTFRVTADQPAINISYAFAAVNNGSPHFCHESPYLNVVLKDSLGNIIGNPELHYSLVEYYCNEASLSVLDSDTYGFTKWINLSLSLLDYVGTNITIEFIASGCKGFHPGYAYIDAAMCNNSFSPNILSINTNTYNLLQSQNNILECGITTASIVAPSGATSYSWTGTGINGVTAQSVTVSQAGTYTVVFNNPSACSNTTSATIKIGAVPDVSLSATTNTVCENSGVNFSFSGANRYIWEPFCGYYGAPGTHNVYPSSSTVYTLTGINSLGCRGTKQYSITVFPNPVISVSGNTTICLGNSTFLTASGADTYTWTGGIYTNTILVTPTVTTSYNIIGKNSITGCMQSKNITVLVTGNIKTTPAIKKLCEGDSLIVTASGATSYSWSTGANTNTVSLKPLTTSNYTVFGETAECGTYSTAFTVTVNPKPILTISYPTPVCSGKSITLTTLSGLTSYTWSTGSNSYYSITTPSNSVIPYTYTLSVAAINSNGCKNSTVSTLTVNPSPNLEANFPTSLCSGSSFTLNFSGANTYTVNSTSLTGSTLNINPTVTTNYTLTGKDAVSCTSSVVASVLVNTGPPSNILSSTSYTVSQGSSFYLNLGSTGDTYTTSAPYTSYNVAGKYFICGPITATTTQVYSVTGTNICGTSTVTFEVVPASTSSVSQGQFWGMTNQGGDYNAGTIYTTDGSGNNQQIEYSFPNNDGIGGVYSLVQLSNGKYYSCTSSGGINNHGTLFEYDAVTNTYTKKFDFDRTPSGISPTGALLQASDGMLYGTTGQGGIYDEGVLFQFDPITGIYTKKIEFSASVTGGGPNGCLVQDTDGKIYGTTTFGGTSGYGVIFQYDPITNIYMKKVDFNGTNGNTPNGSLLKASDGMFYGTTNQGGASNGGIIFQYNPVASIITKKYDFINPSGGVPKAPLMQASDGKLYGTTTSGGANNGGVIYQYDPASNVYIKKYDLYNASVTGQQPQNALTEAFDGKLYGHTFYGGVNNMGVLFQYNPNTNACVQKMDFSSTTGRYFGIFKQAPNGKLYVFSTAGVAASGAIVEYDPVTNIAINKIDFSWAPNGKNPTGKLTRAANGKLYGMTNLGGSNNLGVLFEYDPATHAFSKKIDFIGSTNGSKPNGSLLLTSDNKLYGMTELGGASAQGVLFQFDPVANTYSKKIDFTAATKGSNPKGTLIQASNGKLYGMTYNGGINSKGILFQYDLTSQVLTKKIDFAGADGQTPYADLLEAPDGKFYGMTLSGGNYLGSGGTLFQYDPGTNSLVRKVDFSNLAINGFAPYASLTKANDGKLYGLASLGGQNSGGLLFQYDIATDAYTIKKDFSAIPDGDNPMGTLLSASNGKLYGATRKGGSNDKGVVYEYDPATSGFTNKLNFNNANGAISYGSLIELGIAVNTSSLSNTNQCVGGSVPVQYSLSGSFNSGNVFTAQLSDINGSFSSPTTIGSVTSTTPCVINATIPSTVTSATGYRIRVVSSNPVVIGSDNGSDLTFNILPLPTITVNSGTVCSTKSFTLTPGGGASYNFLNAASVVSPTATTIYIVVGTDANGCSSAATSTVSVLTPSITSNSGNICSGQSFTFTPTGALSYTYSSGSAIVSPSVTSTYTVTGIDANGCIGSATNYVTITANPVVNVTASNSLSCSSTAATLTASGATTYTWMPGALTGNTIAISPSVTTIYTVTGNSASCSNTKTLSVSVTGTLALTTSASNSISCANPNATLTTSGATSYTWNPGNLTGSSVIVSPTVSTIYTVTGTSGSCTNTKTLSLGVTGSALSLTTSVSNSITCAAPSATLTASGATTYTWFPVALTGSSISVSPTVTTTYSVTGSILGCTGTKTLLISVDNTCQDVWPGDANSDGTADNLDVLELGLHYTQTGSARSTTSNSWQSYFADNWVGTITNGKNLNHSDCNGDGTINDDDTLAIFNNYGLAHTFKTAQTTTVNPQVTIVSDQSAVTKGAWGTASIYLGDVTDNINNINGLAFTVDFDNTLIEPNSIYIEYQNSFIDASQNLYFRKLDFANEKIFTATTHTNNTNVSGFGKIATLHYQILSSLNTDEVLNIGLSLANQSDASGVISPLTSGTATLMAIGASVGFKENVLSGYVSVSPNPTNGVLNIGFSSIPQNTKIELYNSIGALVLTEVLSNKNNTINTTQLSNGMYLIKVIENNKVITIQKIVKQ